MEGLFMTGALQGALINEARTLADYISTGPMRNQPTLSRMGTLLLRLADMVEHRHKPDGRDAGAHPNDPYYCRCGAEIIKGWITK